MELEIARLTEVPIRDVWQNEATDFTPWLAQNLDRLGEALGMDLELEGTEAAVGPFSVDILARDQYNRRVVIENQLETTNHDHLGKLLTYAAGYDAEVVVWVVRDFREEHRQALDWLNQRTGVETEFYGVVTKAVKIEDSKAAVVFEVPSRANQVRKIKVSAAPGQVTEMRELQRKFFELVVERMKTKYSDRRTARPQNWLDYATGMSGIVCRASVGRQVRVALYIDVGDKARNKAIYDRLSEQKLAVDQGFGEKLEWERLDSRQASLLAVYRDGSVEGSETELAELADWIFEKLSGLRDKVVPIVKDVVGSLDLDPPEDTASDDGADDSELNLD